MSNYQLPKGYKQTEVGVIPEDWDVQPLCSIAEIRSGIAKNSKVSVSDPILVHYLRVANVQDGFLDLTEMKKIEVSRNDLKRYAVLSGDILMNEGGDLDKLGRGSIWRGEFNPCIHQNHVFVVRSRSYVSSEYLNTWTSGIPARRYFLVAGKQTTNLATINKTALGQLPVALPPLSEQRAIATALSDVDALIAALDKLIAKKRHLKTATMQQLLTGKKRLPGFGEGKGYKKTEVGVIPEDWELITIGTLEPYVTSGSRGWACYYSKVGAPFIRITNLSRQSIYLDLSNLRLVDLPNNESEGKRTELQDGDILISITADIGIIGYIDKSVSKPAYINQHISLVRFDSKKANSKFVAYFLASENVQHLFRGATDQGAKAGLNLDTVRGLRVAFPIIEEQHEVATVLSDMDAEISALEARRAKTQAIKQGMMQELLTGRTRLV